MGDLNFNANEHEPAVAPEPVPTAWYPVRITESGMEPTADKSGSFLKLELTIHDGEYKGRKGFARLNLNNANPVAVEIAQKQLSAICHSVGVMQIQDSKQLLGTKPFQARFVLVPANEKFDASNDIKGFKPLDGAIATAGTTSATSDTTPAWATGNTAPPETPALQASTPPAPPAPPAPTPAPAKSELTMTDKANGVPYDQWTAQGWTDEQLIAEGYAIAAVPSAPPTPPVPPAPPAPTATTNQSAASAEPSAKPPWAQ